MADTIVKESEQKPTEETTITENGSTKTLEENGSASETTTVEKSEKTTTVVKAEDTTVVKAEDTTVVKAEDTTVVKAEDTTVVKAEDTTVVKAEDTTVVKAEDTTVEMKEDTTVEMTEDTNGSSTVTETEVDSATKANIVKQIEYYFGDYNLPRDRFLMSEIKKDEGWVSLSTMLKFTRLARLTKDVSVVANAVKEAEKTIMEVDECLTRIRRSTKHPLPELEEDPREESVKRTIYCKGFSKDGSVVLDDLLEFFKQFGDIDSVRMRNYVDKTSEVQGFKGSVLVVFKTIELAKAFIEGPATQYKKVYLIKKWFADYLEAKKQEIEERKAKKLAKLENASGKNQSYEELPRGNFIRLTGFVENTSREDIKAAVINLTNDCAFVEFKKGDETAFIRFNEADCNKTMLAALKDTLTVKEAKLNVFLVEGEEEEEQLKKANEARRRALSNGPNNFSRKRKFGGGYKGKNNKRARN